MRGIFYLSLKAFGNYMSRPSPCPLTFGYASPLPRSGKAWNNKMDLKPLRNLYRTARYSLYWTMRFSVGGGAAAVVLVTRTAGLPAFILPSPLQVRPSGSGRRWQMGSLLSNSLVTLTEVLLSSMAGTVSAAVLGYFIFQERTVRRGWWRLSGGHAGHSDRCDCTLAGNLVWAGIFSKVLICALIVSSRIVNTVVGAGCPSLA